MLFAVQAMAPAAPCRRAAWPMVRRQTRTPWLPAWASTLRRCRRRRAPLHCSAPACFLLTPLARYATCVVQLHHPDMVFAAEGVTRDVDGRGFCSIIARNAHDTDIVRLASCSWRRCWRQATSMWTHCWVQMGLVLWAAPTTCRCVWVPAQCITGSLRVAANRATSAVS